MPEDPSVPSAEALLARVDDSADDASAVPEELQAAESADLKAVLRDLREHAEERPARVVPLLDGLVALLTDEDRSVRLATAKLFVAVAETEPASVTDVVPDLAARLGDETEFYYVRARAAEALGYVALECPEPVIEPALLAELTVGLEFEAVEVRRKLAKALCHVAVAAPERLGHHADRIADHLDDGDEQVRLYLCSALAAVACERPGAVGEAVAAADGAVLTARLEDENAWVVGRTAETVGLLARADGVEVPVDPAALPDGDALGELADDDTARRFVGVRVAFAAPQLSTPASGTEAVEPVADVDPDPVPDPAAEADASPGSDADDGALDDVGTLEGIRTSTDEAVAAITAPADACPNCGVARPPAGPPICPGCGRPL